MDKISELFPEIYAGVRTSKYPHGMPDEYIFGYTPCDYQLKPPIHKCGIFLEEVWIQQNAFWKVLSGTGVLCEAFAFKFSIGRKGSPLIYVQNDDETNCSGCGASNPMYHKYVFKVYCFLKNGERYFYVDQNCDLIDWEYDLTLQEFVKIIRSVLTRNENLLNCYNFIS